MLIFLDNYLKKLEKKYQTVIEVGLSWSVVVLISLILVIGYAIICTWQGGSFNGGVRFGFPTLIEVLFKCKR